MKVQETRLQGEGMGGAHRQARVLDVTDGTPLTVGQQEVDAETPASDWAAIDTATVTGAPATEEPECRRIF